MKTITMMIGLPRSGKTSWIRDNKEGSAVIVSADELRWLIYNQRFWSEGENLVWSIREIMLKALLQQGVDVIIDEANSTRKRREPIFDLAKRYGYEVEARVILTDASICAARAMEENRFELLSVIERMNKQFEHPSKKEGFSYIADEEGYSMDDGVDV